MPKTAELKGGNGLARKKAVMDEIVIAALMENSTLDAAAKQCGLSVRQLYDRRKEPEFIRQLREAQNDALSGTVRYMQRHTTTAAETLAEICQNGVQEQNRLNAARTILEQAARLTEIVEFAGRLDRLEELNDV